MLGKLLKYEIKATQRIFIPLFVALLLFAGITKFMSSVGSQRWGAPAIITMVIYIVIMAGMFVMSFIVMIQRFYKSLLSDEGYLMLTLPVKPWKHIMCKLLVSMMWIVASTITAVLSILIIALKKGDVGRLFNEAFDFIKKVSEVLDASLYVLAFEIIIGILLSLASGILIVYAAIAIGHLFSQHKLLASFGAFIVLNTLSQILFTAIGSFVGVAFFTDFSSQATDFISIQPIINWVFAYGIILSGLLCAAYFAITNYIINKRLNLE